MKWAKYFCPLLAGLTVMVVLLCAPQPAEAITLMDDRWKDNMDFRLHIYNLTNRDSLQVTGTSNADAKFSLKGLAEHKVYIAYPGKKFTIREQFRDNRNQGDLRFRIGNSTFKIYMWTEAQGFAHWFYWDLCVDPEGNQREGAFITNKGLKLHPRDSMMERECSRDHIFTLIVVQQDNNNKDVAEAILVIADRDDASINSWDEPSKY